MAYAVIRTDLMSGTKQPADLVSLRFYDASGNKAEVENGVIVKLQGYEDGEREVILLAGLFTRSRPRMSDYKTMLLSRRWFA